MNKGKEAAANIPMPEESREQASASRNENEASTSTTNSEKNRKESTVRSSNINFSSIPRPVCSCTGSSRKCNMFAGGWRSKCCTKSLSQFPLPLSSTKNKGRVTGRSITKVAFEKLAMRLKAEGKDISEPIDLKDYWIKAGYNPKNNF